MADRSSEMDWEPAGSWSTGSTDIPDGHAQPENEQRARMTQIPQRDALSSERIYSQRRAMMMAHTQQYLNDRDEFDFQQRAMTLPGYQQQSNYQDQFLQERRAMAMQHMQQSPDTRAQFGTAHCAITLPLVVVQNRTEFDDRKSQSKMLTQENMWAQSIHGGIYRPPSQANPKERLMLPHVSNEAAHQLASDRKNWPTSAYSLLAEELLASASTMRIDEHESGQWGLTKESRKRSADGDMPQHSDRGASSVINRVKAKIKRAKTTLESRLSSDPVTGIEVAPKTFEDLHAQFWIDSRPDIESSRTEEQVPEVNEKSPYTQLEHADSIRVLCVEPGQKDPLRCRLVVSRLSVLEIPYEAVSYVWGDPTFPHSVFTPHGMIKITENLRSVLHHLRLPDKPRYLWADAACINQQDIQERSHQVSLMRQIYMRASGVILWLGPDTSNKARMAFSVISSIGSGGTVNGKPVGQANFYSNGVSSANIPDLPCRDAPPKETFTALWRTVQELFSRDWFWRVWCIQEVALARVANVHWGTSYISWPTLGLAAARLRTGELPIIRRYPMPGVFNAYFMYRISASQSSNDVSGLPPLELSFPKLLALTGQFEVKDPRDRVFGLLGIPTTDADPENGHLFVKPNYFMSSLEVYKEVMEQALKHDLLTGENTNISLLLSAIQHHSHKVEEAQVDQFLRCPDSALMGEDGWPSWIPRWGKCVTQLLCSSSRSLTSVSIPLKIIYQPRLTLHIAGLRHGSIAHLSSPTPTPLKSPLIQSILQTGSKDGRKALAMTLTGGNSWYGTPADPHQHLSDFEAYYSKICTSNTTFEEEAVHRYTQALENATTGRMVFLTSAPTQIGLGPSAAVQGDEITILEGASTPFVLRRVQGSNDHMEQDQDEKWYRVVGECYIYDITESAKQAGKVPSRLCLV